MKTISSPLIERSDDDATTLLPKDDTVARTKQRQTAECRFEGRRRRIHSTRKIQRNQYMFWGVGETKDPTQASMKSGDKYIVSNNRVITIVRFW